MTHNDITGIFEEARVAGRAAAQREMLERIERATDKSKPLDTCGGAILRLDVDGRSKIGKLLSSYEHPDSSFASGTA